ncbi:MAG: phage portal protein [Oscillospiraceae bacterium]
MGLFDLLLETNIEKLQEKNSKTVEIKRLSRLIGAVFAVDCKPLTSEQIEHISEISKTDTDMRINAIIESCRIDGEKFNNPQLMQKIQTVTPVETVKKLFNAGEITKLYRYINDVSGFGAGVVDEIKN